MIFDRSNSLDDPSPRRTLAGCVLGVVLISSVTAVAADPKGVPSVESLRELRTARIAHILDDHQRELETLRRAVTSYPDDLQPLVQLVLYHRLHEVSEGNWPELRARLSERLTQTESLPLSVVAPLASDPLIDPETLRLIADHLLTQSRGPDKDNAPLLEILGSIQLRLNDNAAATTATFEQLVRLRPTESHRWTLLQLYRGLDRWDDTSDLLDSWLENDSSALLRARYVEALGRAGRFDAMEKQLEILRLEPIADLFESERLLMSVTSAAWIFRDAGRDEDAERLFRHAMELGPDQPDTRNALLYLYGTEEELQQVQAAETKRWREEDDPNELLRKGGERLAAGDAEAALDLLERAAPLFPEVEPAWYNLGMAAYRTESWETAAEAFARAGQLNSERAQNFLYGGLALEKLGRCAESVAALTRALELSPDLNTAHYYLAACYARLGETEVSIRHKRLYEAAQEE